MPGSAGIEKASGVQDLTSYVHDQGIINPEMKFWLDQVSGVGYSATLYKTQFADASGTFSKQEHPLGAVTSNGHVLTSYCSDVVVAGSTTGAYYQKDIYIPNIKKYVGKTITIRVMMKADTALNIGMNIARYYGTGGSPSVTDTVYGLGIQTLTTSWADYSFTFTLPSIVGKTLGTDLNSDFLDLQLIYSGGSENDIYVGGVIGQQSGTFDLALMTLNEGSVALPYIPRSDIDELALIGQTFQVVMESGPDYAFLTERSSDDPDTGHTTYYLNIPLQGYMLRPPTLYNSIPLANCRMVNRDSLGILTSVQSCTAVSVYNISSHKYILIALTTLTDIIPAVTFTFDTAGDISNKTVMAADCRY